MLSSHRFLCLFPPPTDNCDSSFRFLERPSKQIWDGGGEEEGGGGEWVGGTQGEVVCTGPTL